MLWIAQLHVSTANRVLEVKEIDEKTVQTVYKWDKETRQKITSIERSARQKAFRNTYSFYGLHIVTDEQRERISKIAMETDAMLKEIDPELSAWPSFIPIDEETIKKDKIYEAVVLAMKNQIYKEMIKRLEKVAKKQLNKRMKVALLRFVEKLKEINVFRDEEIDKELERIKQEIIKERIPEIKKALEEQLGNIDARMTAFIREFG